MYLPLIIFIRRRFPSYKKKIRNTQLYRKVTNTKSAKEIEEEILARRREQIKNTIITDKSYEQFIYVSRAANKWKKKVEKRKEADKKTLEEGNHVTVNVGYGLDPVVEETHPSQLQHEGQYYSTKNIVHSIESVILEFVAKLKLRLKLKSVSVVTNLSLDIRDETHKSFCVKTYISRY